MDDSTNTMVRNRFLPFRRRQYWRTSTRWRVPPHLCRTSHRDDTRRLSQCCPRVLCVNPPGTLGRTRKPCPSWEQISAVSTPRSFRCGCVAVLAMLARNQVTACWRTGAPSRNSHPCLPTKHDTASRPNGVCNRVLLHAGWRLTTLPTISEHAANDGSPCIIAVSNGAARRRMRLQKT